MTKVEPLHSLNMDANQQQAFIRYYRNLPQKTSSTIRFFCHNDYYTVHGEDANLAIQQLHTNIIKYMGVEPKLSYLVLSKGNFEKFVRDLLLVKNYRVEVYVKLSQGRNNDWNLEYKGSPGNLSQFEDILFENNSNIVVNSIIMSVKLIKKTVAVCFVNTTENTFTLGEIADNEYFTEIEALVAQTMPKECIIQSGNSQELNTLHETLTRNGILVVRQKSDEFNGDNVLQDLNRLLYFSNDQARNAASFSEINLTEALGALQAVITYLNLIGDEQNYNQFKFLAFETNKHVRLDTAALYALNIIPKPGATNYSKDDSVFGVLDFCRTVQGRRLLQQWLKQPLRDINTINERLDVVETLCNNSEMRNTLIESCLPHIPDLLMMAKKLCAKKASLHDCYRVYQAVDSVPKIVAALRTSDNTSVKVELINPICDILNDLEKYQLMIEHTLDMNLVEKGEYFIKPSFNDELNELHEKREALQKKMQKLLDTCADELELESGKTMKLDRTDQHGYFFRVTLKEEKSLREAKKFQIIDVIKGGVRFTNKKLSELNESYGEFKEAYEAGQKSVVQELLGIAAGYANVLKQLNSCIAKVDVFVSLANAAATAPIPYVRPKLLEEGSNKIVIKKARHPCLEKQSSISFIPNDIEFVRNEKLLYVITGPNMGGKSTYMRTVGVCILLAQIGSLVPCDSAEISLVDCIFCRVGAEDSDTKGLSTFMMEMVETRSIVRSATSNSLVIIDELGRGTSTYDGCGIAYAIAEHLGRNVKCFTLFATHFHEITDLAEKIPEVRNCHVTVVTSDKVITPLYQIREGHCDKSFGIHCARMVEFNSDLIDSAIAEQKRLEDSEGMKYIADFEASLKRKAIDEGDTIVEAALKKCKALDVENVPDDELLSVITSIKTDLERNSNLFVKGLISSQ